MQALDPDLLLTTSKAAERIGMTKQALSYWRKKGTGPRYIKVGMSRVLYRVSDLDEYIESRTVNPTSPGETRA